MSSERLSMGLWKFSNRISDKDLLEVTEDWAKDPHYVQLYLRKVSKDQTGIGFVYKYDSSVESYKDFFESNSDKLKRKFGNDLVGWDIDSSGQPIKGF